jgi:hypothetical protein
MGTICYHRSYYNNIVHLYTTCDKTWEQSVTTGAVITTLHHYLLWLLIVPMFCRMLCSDVQCCYNRSCGNRLFPCFVACCVVMHSVVIAAPVVTDCSLGIRQNMGTISNHKSCYNNTVHHYTTYDKTCEQSVTTGAVITILYITTQHTTKHVNNQ